MTREEQINEKAYELGQMCFPDEHNIWARENLEAQMVEWACKQMLEWGNRTMIDKACEWLESMLKDTLGYYAAAEFADTFRKAMEE